MTLKDMVLVTILRMERDKGPVSTIQDIVVASWELFPKEFGMTEYPYPDSNRTMPRVYILLGEGMIEVVISADVRAFVLTERGRAHAKLLERYLP